MSDMTPEQEAQVQEYAQAFRQEFTTATEKKSQSKAEQRESIHLELDDIVPDAIAAVRGIVKHSKNESLRLNASKWIIDLKLQSDKAENDPMTVLIRDMQRELRSARAPAEVATTAKDESAKDPS